MKRFELTYKPYGDRSILIEWPSKIDENVLFDVLNFKNIIQKLLVKQKVYIKSAYNSILISYDCSIDNFYNEISTLKTYYSSTNDINKSTFKLWKVPVCYEDEFGIDLDELAQAKNSSKEEIIKLHSSQIYRVYFIGFLPGFLYLGGLDKNLHFPRKSMPRLSIEKGAVAIGGDQTGVYPNRSPGGWNIIGNSPICFFDVNKSEPCFAKAGDKIQFYEVTRKEYDDIKTLVEAGVYQLESEVIND